MRTAEAMDVGTGRGEMALVSRADRAAGGLAFVPGTLGEAMELSRLLAGSSIVPRDFQGKPGDVFVAMQYGMEVGLSPLQAIQSVAVINGRPCMWGDAVLGIVRASGLLEDIEETFVRDGDKADQVYAACRVKRKGDDRSVERRFTWQDAQRASLAEKALYKQYPQRMLAMRARSWALRDVFPDVLKGLQVREEVEDFSALEPATPDTPTPTLDGMMPRRKATELPPASVVIEAPAVVSPGSAAGTAGTVRAAEPSADDIAHAAMLGEDVTPPTVPPSAESGEASPPARVTFQIGPKTYETAGMTKEQMLRSFKLAEAVNKAAKLKGQGDLAHAMLAKEFGVVSRTELTEEQAERFLVRLREVAEAS